MSKELLKNVSWKKEGKRDWSFGRNVGISSEYARRQRGRLKALLELNVVKDIKDKKRILKHI